VDPCPKPSDPFRLPYSDGEEEVVNKVTAQEEVAEEEEVAEDEEEEEIPLPQSPEFDV
jgi:hypothetical protein